MPNQQLPAKYQKPHDCSVVPCVKDCETHINVNQKGQGRSQSAGRRQDSENHPCTKADCPWWEDCDSDLWPIRGNSKKPHGCTKAVCPKPCDSYDGHPCKSTDCPPNCKSDAGKPIAYTNKPHGCTETVCPKPCDSTARWGCVLPDCPRYYVPVYSSFYENYICVPESAAGKSKAYSGKPQYGNHPCTTADCPPYCESDAGKSKAYSGKPHGCTETVCPKPCDSKPGNYGGHPCTTADCPPHCESDAGKSKAYTNKPHGCTETVCPKPCDSKVAPGSLKPGQHGCTDAKAVCPPVCESHYKK